jgi:hypothetical protein
MEAADQQTCGCQWERVTALWGASCGPSHVRRSGADLGEDDETGKKSFRSWSRRGLSQGDEVRQIADGYVGYYGSFAIDSEL